MKKTLAGLAAIGTLLIAGQVFAQNLTLRDVVYTQDHYRGDLSYFYSGESFTNASGMTAGYVNLGTVYTGLKENSGGSALFTPGSTSGTNTEDYVYAVFKNIQDTSTPGIATGGELYVFDSTINYFASSTSPTISDMMGYATASTSTELFEGSIEELDYGSPNITMDYLVDPNSTFYPDATGVFYITQVTPVPPGTDSNYVNFSGSGTLTPVPEPATMLLFGTGLFGLATIGRRKFKA